MKKYGDYTEKCCGDYTVRFFHLTIGKKFIGLLIVLLGLSIFALGSIATKMFSTDNVALVQEMNITIAASRATQIREVFEGLTQKIRLLGGVLVQPSLPPEISGTLSKSFFEEDPGVLGVMVYQCDASGCHPNGRSLSSTFEQIGDAQAADTVDKISHNVDFSFSALAKGEVQISSIKLIDGSSSILLGIPFIKSSDTFSHVLVALLRDSKFGKTFGENDLVTAYMVDKKGKVLAHPDASLVASAENLSYLPIVKDLVSGKFNNGQSRYVEPETQEARLGAFRRVGFGGLGVVAEVPEDKAYEIAHQMQRRAALLACAILCFAILCGYLMSENITRPIEKLVDAAEEIARGNFDVTLSPKGNDEVAELSRTFGVMVEGLKERDKVKSLFTKFHNKEIVDKLTSGEVKLGGERKEAAVLFTDLRGFTAFSDSLAPERVVEMLNEYMTRMVTVIRNHGGVVDKFVGDAIMAVWGVPESKPEDALRALSACLEMRKELAILNQLRISRKEVPLKIGMGLNFGDVTAGNIGSSERMEYTVIGDAVNVASRIESKTKEMGTDLLVSKALVAQVEKSFLFQSAGLVELRGKSAALELFKVRGYINEAGTPVLVETPYSSFAEPDSDGPSIIFMK